MWTSKTAFLGCSNIGPCTWPIACSAMTCFVCQNLSKRQSRETRSSQQKQRHLRDKTILETTKARSPNPRSTLLPSWRFQWLLLAILAALLGTQHDCPIVADNLANLQVREPFRHVTSMWHLEKHSWRVDSEIPAASFDNLLLRQPGPPGQ